MNHGDHMPTDQPTDAPPSFEATVDEWSRVKQEAKKLSEREMVLRKALFAAAFPHPKEGANNLTLADGRIFAATHKINRSLDEAALPSVLEELAKLNSENVNPDALFPVKRTLAVGEYKGLSPVAKAIVDLAVTAKPGAPEVALK